MSTETQRSRWEDALWVLEDDIEAFTGGALNKYKTRRFRQEERKTGVQTGPPWYKDGQTIYFRKDRLVQWLDSRRDIRLTDKQRLHLQRLHERKQRSKNQSR